MRGTKLRKFIVNATIPFLALFLAFLMPTNVYAENDSNGNEVETIDLSEYIFQAGGLGYYENDELSLEDGNYTQEAPHWLSSGSSAIENTIYNGLLTRSDSINLSSYNIDTSSVFALYTKVVNQHPELFYVTGGLSWSISGGNVSYIYPKYSAEYSQADVDTFNQRVAQIMAGVDSSWPTIEKILYLHDYLVTNVEYDQTYSKYDAYNALVEGSSVCQGYSLAFTCLMNNIGVNSDIVTSRNLNHAWNLIELNGEYFYTDATWDDPLGTGITYCGHENFMVDRAGIVATGHNTTDWIGNISGINVYSGISTSSRYNNYFWTDMITAVPLIGTKAGYLTEGKLNIFDFNTGAVNSYDRNMGTWFVWNSSGWWVEDYCSMAVANNAFYYTTAQEIYCMQPDGTTAKVYTLSDAEAATGYIYGLTASGRNLTYILQTEPMGNITGTGTYRIKTQVDNFVTRMYEQCLGRTPDQAGLDGWVGQLEGGYMNGAQIAQQFVFSNEMLAKNLSNKEFLMVLYRAMMGREADTDGLNGWVIQLDNKYMTRSQVTKSFVESAEFTNICASYGIIRGDYDASMAPIEHFVTRFYTLCLERNADQAGLYGWVGNLKNKYMNGAQIADSFFFSKEFENRNVSNEKYVELLYNTLMGRPSDASGKAAWVNQLAGGHMTRKDMMKAFIESTEFTDICASYGITRGSL